MKQHARNAAQQQTAVVIQQTSVTDSRGGMPLCLLSFHAPEASGPACMAELAALASTLAPIRRRLLIHFAGVSDSGLARPRRLPANVELLEPDALTTDGLCYRGRKLSAAVAAARSTQRKELAPTEASVIRVLNFVRRNEDVALISHAVKQDPGLLHGLLRYLNTVKMAYNTANGGFRNIEQAIMFMGYREFSRWLSLFLLHSAMEGAMPALYLASIVRARQMEILAKPAGFSSKQQDPIFITGVFSLLDQITGLPMAVILESLELDAPVRAALLEDSGDYAALLRLACACQNGSPENLTRHITATGIAVREANLALLKAIQFASDFD